jgi:hypothetical protein
VTIVALMLMLTGCFGNAAMVKEMRNNNATFCAQITTPWGQATYLQTNPVYGTASCNGLTASYGNPNAPGTVSVPITVTPQFSIGAPAK